MNNLVTDRTVKINHIITYVPSRTQYIFQTILFNQNFDTQVSKSVKIVLLLIVINVTDITVFNIFI